MTEIEGFSLVDPFQGQSILSLNPRTFRDSKDALKSNDLEAIHQHLSSMALQSPDKHFEKARSIVDGSSELLNTKESEGNAKDKENPQERRPALVRKRARFSLKSDTSQPFTALEPNIQIDQLQDPEEFFAAYEKLENARKEMKRQRGGEDLNEVKISSTARHRRPEIPGRKVSYKHHGYSIQPKNDASLSQETLRDNIKSPPTRYSQQESVTPNWESQEEEVAGSIAKSEERVNKLFDELISSNIDSLDGNEALSFLKDRLKIKPVDIDNLRLPDFHELERLDFISPVKNLIKDQNILSDICSLPDGLKGKTLGKQKTLSDSPFNPLASPTPPKSPFLAISTFGRRISKSIASVDPFSTRDIDSSPTTSSIEIIGGQSAHVNKDEDILILGTLDSLAENKVTKTAVADISQKVSAGPSVHSPESDKFLNENISGRSANSLSEPLIGPEDCEQCHNVEERAVDDNLIGPHADTDIQTDECIKENAEDMVQKAASTTKLASNVEDITDKAQLHSLRDMEENVEDVPEKAGSSTSPETNVEVSTIENMTSHQNQSGANFTEDLAASSPPQNPDIVPEQQNEECSRPLMNKRKKTTKTRQVDLKKKRQSLAGAGTSWTSGVRKSTRVRRRPLEYWKGERFLYGRVYNSLPTVIGVKYISPTKDNGKPGFKVESFVSDKYKELVELTALH